MQIYSINNHKCLTISKDVTSSLRKLEHFVVTINRFLYILIQTYVQLFSLTCAFIEKCKGCLF